MRCILNTAYFVSSRLTAVVGLKFYGEKLEPVIGLVSGPEEIVFTSSEWIRFMASKREMDLYFLGFSPLELNPSFPDMEILFSNHGEKQIVIRSTKTWSFIRLVEWELSKLFNLSSCIDNYIKKISFKKSFANFRFFEISNAISELVKNKRCTNSYSSSCFDSEIISMELENYYPEDQVSRELLYVFNDMLTSEIEKKIMVGKSTSIDSLCEGIDVPY